MTISMNQVRAMMSAAKSEVSPFGDKAMYPFYNMAFNTAVTVRLLPVFDEKGNPTDELPYVVKYQSKLAFDGAINSDYDTTETVVVTAVSPETFGLKCPIKEAIAPLWKGGEDEKKIASQYYRKPTTIFNALIVNSPLTEATPPDSPIRRLHLNKSVFDIIRQVCMDETMENAVWDLDKGRSFVIRKTQQGSWASYVTSSFSFNESSLSKDDRAKIAQHGVPSLQTLLGEKPDAAAIARLKALFTDSIKGLPFDAAKHPTFKAFPASGPQGTSSNTLADVLAALDAPVVAKTPQPYKTGNQHILDLKAKQKAGASAAV